MNASADKPAPVLIIDHAGGTHEGVVRRLPSGTPLYLEPQPPAEAQAQYSDVISDGGMDPRNQQAQGGGGLSDEIIEALDSLDDDADHLRATGDPAMSRRVRDARNILHAAIFRNTPPSAPVGVEVMDRAMDAYRAACAEWRKNPDNRDEPEAMFGVRAVVEALAQQPAAVDEAAITRMCEEHYGVQFRYSKAARDRMRRLLTAALAAQPQGGAKP